MFIVGDSRWSSGDIATFGDIATVKKHWLLPTG
jgi:hypothetical protein